MCTSLPFSPALCGASWVIKSQQALISGFFSVGEYSVAYALAAAAYAILVSARIGKVDTLVLLLIAILSARAYGLT